MSADTTNKMDDRERPVYLISIVAEMLGVHPQTLRTYEREGFITPGRAGGETGQRLYSRSDVERLSLILDLTRNMGVNRAGVDIILRMQSRLERLQGEVEVMIEHLEAPVREEFKLKIRSVFEGHSEED